MPLEQVSPQLDLWSDASDVGWGAHLGEEVASDLWAPEEVELSINVRELLAIERALLWFAPQLCGSSSCVVSSVYHGETQRAGRCLVSSESDPGLRVDSEAGSVSGTAQEVAGFHRPVRHLSKSPLFSIFFSLPRSERSGNGCSSSDLEWVAGVRLSSLVSNASCAEEAPVVL